MGISTNADGLQWAGFDVFDLAHERAQGKTDRQIYDQLMSEGFSASQPAGSNTRIGPTAWSDLQRSLGSSGGSSTGGSGGTAPLPGQPGSTPIGSVNYDGTPKAPFTPDLDSFRNGTLTGPASGPINAASVAYQYSPGGERYSAENNGGDRYKNEDAGNGGGEDDSYTPIDSSAEWMKYLNDSEQRKGDVDPYYWDSERYASSRKHTGSGQPLAGTIFTS